MEVRYLGAWVLWAVDSRCRGLIVCDIIEAMAEQRSWPSSEKPGLKSGLKGGKSLLALAEHEGKMLHQLCERLGGLGCWRWTESAKHCPESHLGPLQGAPEPIGALEFHAFGSFCFPGRFDDTC